MIDQKEALREAARGYLLEYHSAKVAEFDAVFEPVYRALQDRDATEAMNGSALSEEDTSFDGTGGESALVAMTCFIGYALLKAALKDFAKRDLPKILDRAEIALSKPTGRPELVSAIRKRVEGILQSL